MKSAALLGGQLAASSIAGYAFQKSFAYYYGASIEKSVFDIAFSVPTILIYIGGFALTHSVVVSLFTRLRVVDESDLDSVFSSLLNLSCVVLLSLIGITILALPQFVQMVAPGFGRSEQYAIERLILWMLPLALIFGASSFLSAIAIAWRIPLGQEFLLLFSRIAVVIWIITRSVAVPLEQLAAVLIATSFLGLIFQWFLISRLTKLRYRVVIDVNHPDVRRALTQFGGFLIVAITAQLAAAYSKRMATFSGPDAVALLGYANSIVEPLGSITGKVLAFQLGQPVAARFAENSSRNVTRSAMHRSLGIAAASGLFLMSIAVWLAGPIVDVLFGGGEFDATAVQATGQFVRVMALGLPAYVVFWTLLYPLLSLGRHSATVAHVVGHGSQIAMIWFLYDDYDAFAIAASFAFVLWVQAGVGLALLVRKTRLAYSASQHR